MFAFIKKVLFTGFKTLSSVNLLSETLLKCVSMNKSIIQSRIQSKIRNCYFNSDEPVFYPFMITKRIKYRLFTLVLKQVNAVIVVTISMIQMQKCVFLMLLKT